MAHSVVITVPVVQEGILSQLFSLQQYQLSQLFTADISALT